jgi:hypothetical protein
MSTPNEGLNMGRFSKISGIVLAASVVLFASCKNGNSPTTTDKNDLYLTVKQNVPSCPLTLTVTGPTSFQDVVGSSASSNSLISINYSPGSYTFYFNGATDGVVHDLSGAETIKCSPASTASCASWTYTVQP